MATLYVFAIGGTGERVLRSLVMELAGGMRLKNWNIIQPIIIDSDADSKAIKNATGLITAYNKVRNLYVTPDYIKKDAQELSKLLEDNHMYKVAINDPIMLNISGTEAEDLQHFVGKEKIPSDLQTEMDSLYSSQAQTMDLRAGFVGNPSIGSVVLAKTLKKNECANLIKNIGQGDGIFIVGSIFGGTGAAGIPLLINKILTQKKSTKGLKLGVLAVFPYFNVGLPDSEPTDGFSQNVSGKVRGEGFSIKTKAALNYYDKYVKGLSSMYYIGTGKINLRSEFNYCVGGEAQDNPANLIELIAANAIAHFSENAQGWTQDYIDSEFDREKKFTQYYRFEINDGDNSDKGGITYNLQSLHTPDFRKVFVRLAFFWYIWEVCAPQYVMTRGNQWSSALGMDGNKLTTLKRNHLNDFITMYQKWKVELMHPNHKMRFRFFNDDGSKEDLYKAQEVMTQRFFPSTIACEKRGFVGKSVVTPDITGRMNKFYNDKNKEEITATEDDKRFKRAVFSSISTIETIVNDKNCINLN